MSQVFGIGHAAAATLIYLAVLIYSPIMTAFAVLGATIGTFTGRLSAMPSLAQIISLVPFLIILSSQKLTAVVHRILCACNTKTGWKCVQSLAFLELRLSFVYG